MTNRCKEKILLCLHDDSAGGCRLGWENKGQGCQQILLARPV